MDSLGWDDDSQVLTNSSSLWRNQQHDSVDLGEDIFHQIQVLQKTQTSAPQLNSNSERHQELKRLVANTMLEKSSGAGAICDWGDASAQELYSSSLINKPYSVTCMADFSMSGQPRININGLQYSKAGISTGSLDRSLDCLLSATNSNTDTSVEDDGISMIFNDCRNLRSFAPNSSAQFHLGSLRTIHAIQEIKRSISQ